MYRGEDETIKTVTDERWKRNGKSKYFKDAFKTTKDKDVVLKNGIV